MDAPSPGPDPARLFEAAAAAFEAGRLAESAALFSDVARLRPDVSAAHDNLARIRLATGDETGAVSAASAGLARHPGHPKLLAVRGAAYLRLGRANEAVGDFRNALALEPGLTEHWMGLADALRQGGEPAAAEAIYRQVLERIPGLREARNNLALTLLGQARRHEALALLRDLAHDHPDDADILANHGQTLAGLGRFTEAVAPLTRAWHLAGGRPALAVQLHQALAHQCDWSAMAPVAEALHAAIDRGEAISPFALVGLALNPQTLADASRQYAAQVRAELALPDQAAPRPAARPRDRAIPLRVGYISPDFRNHSLAHSFLDVAARHRRQGFVWHGYKTGNEPADGVTQSLAGTFDHFRDLSGASARTVADRIGADGLDLLVDLSGPTRDSALDVLEYRPAPVQAHWLGYGASTGSLAVDWLLTDRIHTSPAMAAAMHERPAWLETSFMAASRPEIDRTPAARADEGLPQSGPVLATFNAPHKIRPAAFAAWLAVLRAVPEATLWLGPADPAARRNLQAAAEAEGLSGSRLVFAERRPRRAHLARLSLAALALDTWPHNGGVTTLDALWAGVPVLTVMGATPGSRVGASMLHAAGLDELVCTGSAHFVARARTLLQDRDARQALCRRLAAARESSRLFDVGYLARDLERCYQMMCSYEGDATNQGPSVATPCRSTE